MLLCDRGARVTAGRDLMLCFCMLSPGKNGAQRQLDTRRRSHDYTENNFKSTQGYKNTVIKHKPPERHTILSLSLLLNSLVFIFFLPSKAVFRQILGQKDKARSFISVRPLCWHELWEQKHSVDWLFHNAVQCHQAIRCGGQSNWCMLTFMVEHILARTVRFFSFFRQKINVVSFSKFSKYILVPQYGKSSKTF